MVPGIPSLDVVAQGEFGAHYVVYEDKDDGYKACQILLIKQLISSFKMVMQHSTKEAMFAAAMFTVIVIILFTF